jgi:hypothetical protein
MRSRSTNILQVIVIITGIVYIFTGAVFFYSPISFVNIFSVDVADDWSRVIQYDSFIAPLFFFARSFSAMMLSSGLSMILPLYDPLKYRGLIYYTGIIFPILSFIILLYNSIRIDYGSLSGIEVEHRILLIFGIVYLIIFAATLFGLILTRKAAKAGVE